MDITVRQELRILIRRDSQFVRMPTDPTEAYLRRFTNDFAKFSGEIQITFPWDALT
jgi:hypothetical protein